jgi:hypothetical protein
MALQRVAQKNYTGCFVAAVAMLLGKTYEDTFRLLHPGKDPAVETQHGFLDMSVTNAAFQCLDRVGIKGRPSKLKRFASYRKRNQHALLIIRWSFSPDLCHTIVYDGDEHKFIDPSYGEEVRKYALKNLEQQLDSAILIDSIPTENRHDLPRSNPADSGEIREGGVRQDSGNPNGQTPVLPKS